MSQISAKKNVERRVIIRLAESLTPTSNSCDNFLHVLVRYRNLYTSFFWARRLFMLSTLVGWFVGRPRPRPTIPLHYIYTPQKHRYLHNIHNTFYRFV